jgi:hypothetical protein
MQPAKISRMMRSILRGGLAFALLANLWASAVAAEAPPVVVELFTSQGCSSCPAADAYLGELAQRPSVLALSFHVDYWNGLGWADPYATRGATQRQRAYAQRLALRYVYTPQIVVNGAAQAIGSERPVVDKLIEAMAGETAPAPALSLARGADGIAVHVGAGAAAEPCTVWLVGFDRQHATRVRGGENGGRTLTNYQVVRRFENLGTWKGEALDLALPGASPDPEGGLAVLLQAGATGRILAAARLAP